MKKILSIIFIVLFAIFMIWGSTSLLMRTRTYQTPVEAQDYYDYVIYVNRDTHKAYVYEHGRFIPLYGTDNKPIIINIDE